MKFIFLIFVGVVLYFISRGYKTEKYENIKLDIKENFQGDLMNHEAGLLIALMAKVAKADGDVCELEVEILNHTFNDISSHFENSSEIKNKLKIIYEEEQKSFDNTPKICEKLYKLTKSDYQKRINIMEYLLNLAFIDKEFSKTEQMIVEDIANFLKIKKDDFNSLVNKFKEFFENQKNSATMKLDDAYATLEITKEASDSDIKKKYRELVRVYHPDIVTGQGASQNIIDEATVKLQKINEAYEIIKKSRK